MRDCRDVGFRASGLNSLKGAIPGFVGCRVLGS